MVLDKVTKHNLFWLKDESDSLFCLYNRLECSKKIYTKGSDDYSSDLHCNSLKNVGENQYETIKFNIKNILSNIVIVEGIYTEDSKYYISGIDDKGNKWVITSDISDSEIDCLISQKKIDVLQGYINEVKKNKSELFLVGGVLVIVSAAGIVWGIRGMPHMFVVPAVVSSGLVASIYYTKKYQKLIDQLCEKQQQIKNKLEVKVKKK